MNPYLHISHCFHEIIFLNATESLITQMQPLFQVQDMYASNLPGRRSLAPCLLQYAVQLP